MPIPPPPALTCRLRASQPATADLPAAVSGRSTSFEPEWAKRTLRCAVSAEGRGWSKVEERPCTGTVSAPPGLAETVTFAFSDPSERIAPWPLARIFTEGCAANAAGAASANAPPTSSATAQWAPGTHEVGRRHRVLHRGQRRRNL